MSARYFHAAAGALLIVGGCAEESEISLDEVPPAVIEATRAALPGIEFTEIEVERGGDQLVYELEGMVDGEEKEIRLTPDGTVIEIKSED